MPNAPGQPQPLGGQGFGPVGPGGLGQGVGPDANQFGNAAAPQPGGAFPAAPDNQQLPGQGRLIRLNLCNESKSLAIKCFCQCQIYRCSEFV